jgi:hypothetical protein
VAKAEQYRLLLKEGVHRWNAWRDQNPDEHPDLTHADLQGANLSRANLSFVDLSEARLNRSDLSRAILNEAKLVRTNFSHATLSGTSFGNVDLSSAVGLDSVHHKGPSIISVGTLFQSKAAIPGAFLRGAGVPDALITYVRPLTAPIEYYSCFLSYSTHDQAFADRLYADLQANGIRCWFAPADIRAGAKLTDQIEQAIRLHDKLLLVISQHSMTSNWVRTEVAAARRREEREHERVLFPISIVPFDSLRKWSAFDSETGNDIGREIREYFIPDFSNWKDVDSYRRSFSFLLQDLTAARP